MEIDILKDNILKQNKVFCSFLNDPENKRLYNKVVESNREDLLTELNKRFKEFFLEIRLRKYISTIIHNSVVELDIQRRKKEQFLAPYDERVQLKYNYSASFYIDKLSSIYTDKKINDVLKALTEKEKKVISLLFFKDLKEVEVAKLLNISQQAVSKTKQRALQKIKMKMREEND